MSSHPVDSGDGEESGDAPAATNASNGGPPAAPGQEFEKDRVSPGFGDDAEGACADDPASAFPVEVGASPPPPPLVDCWRCGKQTAGGGACVWCGARFEVLESLALAAKKREPSPILRLVAVYSVLLLTAAVVGSISAALSEEDSTGGLVHYEVRTAEVILEAIWTAAVVVAIVAVPRPKALAIRGAGPRAAAWLGALPGLGAVLALNIAYHGFLEKYVAYPFDAEGFQPEAFTRAGLIFTIAAICIQPGIVEELFFRYLALGTLRGMMGDHAAVVVSSAMFGLAHVHVPLSIPVLICVGLGLGYVRLISGSLLLPMLLHALHNGAVLWLGLHPWTLS